MLRKGESALCLKTIHSHVLPLLRELRLKDVKVFVEDARSTYTTSDDIWTTRADEYINYSSEPDAQEPLDHCRIDIANDNLAAELAKAEQHVLAVRQIETPSVNRYMGTEVSVLEDISRPVDDTPETLDYAPSYSDKSVQTPDQPPFYTERSIEALDYTPSYSEKSTATFDDTPSYSERYISTLDYTLSYSEKCVLSYFSDFEVYLSQTGGTMMSLTSTIQSTLRFSTHVLGAATVVLFDQLALARYTVKASSLFRSIARRSLLAQSVLMRPMQLFIYTFIAFVLWIYLARGSASRLPEPWIYKEGSVVRN